MAFLGWTLSPSYEVALYTLLLLVLWLLIRLIASSMNNLLTYFREGSLSVDPFLNDVTYPVSYWTEKGKRPYQEDRFHAMKAQKHESSLYGVFDGHGGSNASQHCRDNMLFAISTDAEWEQDPHQSLIRNFLNVDSVFSAKARAKYWNDGTTAIVAAINNNKVYVANAGDSRAIIVQSRGTVVPMSHDHRPDRKDEEARIRRLGGKLAYWGRWRVEGVLAVSRAIGDVSLQPYITSHPEITTKSIDAQDEFLVIASDGLWDVMENEEVAKFLMQIASKTDFVSLAKALVTESMRRGTADNVTAVVVDIKRRVVSKDSAPVITQAVPIASPSSSEVRLSPVPSSSSTASALAETSSQTQSEFFEDEKDSSDEE